MRARYHNARICTLEDVDYWIGAIYEERLRGYRFCCVSPGLDTEAEVVEWCRSELRKRGVAEPFEIVDTTTTERSKS